MSCPHSVQHVPASMHALESRLWNARIGGLRAPARGNNHREWRRWTSQLGTPFSKSATRCRQSLGHMEPRSLHAFPKCLLTITRRNCPGLPEDLALEPMIVCPYFKVSAVLFALAPNVSTVCLSPIESFFRYGVSCLVWRSSCVLCLHVMFPVVPYAVFCFPVVTSGHFMLCLTLTMMSCPHVVLKFVPLSGELLISSKPEILVPGMKSRV